MDAAQLSQLSARIASQQAMIDRLIADRSRSDEDMGKMADIQSRADSVLSMHGIRAKPPMIGEFSYEYRIRMANAVKKHSQKWADFPIEGVRKDAFEARIEDELYSDSAIAAKTHANIPDGELRCIPKTSYGGHHTINEYFGSPRAWMDPIAGPVRQYVKSFNTEGTR